MGQTIVNNTELINMNRACPTNRMMDNTTQVGQIIGQVWAVFWPHSERFFLVLKGSFAVAKRKAVKNKCLIIVVVRNKCHD